MRRAFFFHYNKPASRAVGRPQLSVHYRDRCLIVDGVTCSVPISSRNRKTQPRCVMAGRAMDVQVVGGIAHIK